MGKERVSSLVVITDSESAYYNGGKPCLFLQKHSGIVGPLQWKSRVILTAQSVITDSHCLRLALVLVPLTERSSQQALSSASLTYCQREGRPPASYTYEEHVVHPTTR